MRLLVATYGPKSEQWLSQHLRSLGSVVEYADNGRDALEYALRYGFDVIVLGLQLPDMRGAALIRRMRAAGVEVPIMALASVTDAEPRVAALQAGADDVMVLPLDQAELNARLHALLRRSRGHSQQTLSVGPVSFNLETREVVACGNAVHLTVKETAIFELLLLRCNTPLSKEIFLSQLYNGADAEPDSKIIDVFVCKLRRKLADAGAPNLIETVWGRGYMVRNTSRQSSPQPQEAGRPVAFASMLEPG